MTFPKPHDEAARARQFNEIAKNIFAPIYPVLAQILLDKSPAKKGVCLDLGSGPGHLAMAIAKISSFTTFSLDLSFSALKLALDNFKESGLESRIIPVQSDVHTLPFHDSSIDFVMSRGSIFFWEDPVKVFNEVHRILKPGCISCIGGGFGTPELKAAIMEKMEQKTGDFKENSGRRMDPENLEKLHSALTASSAIIHSFEMDDTNLWFIIEKEYNEK